MKMKSFDTVIRNRRGAVCAVCCALLGTLTVILSTWALCCLLDDYTLHPLPDGTIPLVGVLMAAKAFQYQDDRKAAAPPAR